MGKKINWHIETLSHSQKRILSSLCPILSAKKFYLAGETAVALYFGHRHSVDLDFFTTKGLDEPIKLAEELKNMEFPLRITYIEKGTLHTYLSNVKTSFLRFAYPLLSPLEEISQFSCSVASLKDLACMKLLAVSQRGAKKDFIDIYAFLKNGFSLGELLKLYKEKFTLDDLTHTLYALSYFRDADRERTPRMLWKTKWKEIKNYIRQAVEEYAKGTFE